MMPRIPLQHGEAILSRLPDGEVCGVEVGVGAGELSAYLMERRPDLSLIMVDSWRYCPPGDAYRIHSKHISDPNGVRTPQQVRRDEKRAMAVASEHGCRVLKMTSVDAAQHVEPESLDFAFIDADHRYEATLEDCDAWLHAIKPGGWIGGHDYDRFRDGGVKQAVTDFAGSHDLTVGTGMGWTWFCDVQGVSHAH